MPRPAVRLLHAGHGDERDRPRAAPSEGRPSRRSARSSKATSAAAPATTTSSRRCSRAPPPWASRRTRMGATRPGRDRRNRSAARRTTRFLTGAGQYTDDVTSAEPDARVLPALAARAREDPQDRHGQGEGRAGRGRRSSPAPTSTGVNGLPCGWLITGTDGKPMNEPPHPVLAQGKVRHVGDQVALVIAETPHQAKDAAELIDVDYDVLPAVVNCVDALKPGAPQIHDAGAGQQVLHVGAGRQGGGRRRVRQGRARHEARHRQQPADPERDRAARRRRVVQPRRRQLHALRRQPESARRAAADDGVRARPAGAQGARDRAGRRRRLRLEDLPLRRRDGAGLGVEARQPPDQVGGRAQRERSSPTRTAATT